MEEKKTPKQPRRRANAAAPGQSMEVGDVARWLSGAGNWERAGRERARAEEGQPKLLVQPRWHKRILRSPTRVGSLSHTVARHPPSRQHDLRPSDDQTTKRPSGQTNWQLHLFSLSSARPGPDRTGTTGFGCPSINPLTLPFIKHVRRMLAKVDMVASLLRAVAPTARLHYMSAWRQISTADSR
ncbi:unnamed protein product [Protopolystoma xenopodis]|uniref:Uncharacterized protein n=1 Tax=Protopolystoma xenopodis TaxID=117903 RepID=A0A3S5FE63_9PLAT|nr:unnamed protein product [Protopolystoma xenopodis]